MIKNQASKSSLHGLWSASLVITTISLLAWLLSSSRISSPPLASPGLLFSLNSSGLSSLKTQMKSCLSLLPVLRSQWLSPDLLRYYQYMMNCAKDTPCTLLCLYLVLAVTPPVSPCWILDFPERLQDFDICSKNWLFTWSLCPTILPSN